MEESIAYELADIAVKLHKNGLVEPYEKVVKARDVLLLILDEKATPVPEQEKADKKDESTIVQSMPIPLVGQEQPPQDTKTRKLEYVAA
ncbi:MAG: hypothetical protein WC521_03165 [Bdellovibrionales bacterium]